MLNRVCENTDCTASFLVPSRAYRKRYCSSSCAAHVNNTLHPKRKPLGSCKFCSAPIPRGRTYCDLHKGSSGIFTFIDDGVEVRMPLRPKEAGRVQDWLDGRWSGGNEIQLSTTIRKYVLARANYACRVCGFNAPHPVDGASILEVNHIDGNGGNHKPENLEALCPNDHAMTPSYRGRNLGNGRKIHYIRVNRSKKTA